MSPLTFTNLEERRNQSLANPVRKATFRANVNDVITDIFVRTSSDNVVIDSEGTLLSDYLVNVVLQDDLSEAIANLKAEIIDGAPEIYDTLKEIADYIKQHGDFVQYIEELVQNKADKSDVDEIANSLQALSAALETKSTVYYSQTQPSDLKLGDMWVQPVQDASVLKSLE